MYIIVVIKMPLVVSSGLRLSYSSKQLSETAIMIQPTGLKLTPKTLSIQFVWRIQCFGCSIKFQKYITPVIAAICYLALPPKHGGDFGTVFALLSHCSGVLA